ncbi:hypothetical protein C8R45DRAFT_987090 [Mycena sanguinolenta]|nr:hypothetical protein C8R45DRAFT_987090 [Mycena sanguinolenta]
MFLFFAFLLFVALFQFRLFGRPSVLSQPQVNPIRSTLRVSVYSFARRVPLQRTFRFFVHEPRLDLDLARVLGAFDFDAGALGR